MEKNSAKYIAAKIIIKLHKLIEKFYNDNNPDDLNGLFTDTHEERLEKIHNGLMPDEAFAWTKKLAQTIGINEQRLYFNQSLLALCTKSENDAVIEYSGMAIEVFEESFQTERFTRFLKEGAMVDTALRPEPAEVTVTVPTLSET